jgi:hypothetical protein
MVLSAGALGMVMALVPASPALAATWTVATTPNPATLDNRFNGVDVLSTSDGWAVGSSQTAWNTPTVPLAVRWNGSTWSSVATPAVSGSAALNAVDGSASANVWAVGSAGTSPLTELWNGSAWGVVASPPPAGATAATLRGVKTLAANNAWAVGDYTATTSPGRRTLILRWNGTAWSHVSSPNPDGTQNMLAAVDGTANDLWAVGNQGTDGYGGDTVAGLMLRWNGSSWSNVALPGGSGWQTGFSTRKLHDLVVVASTDVWAVGTAFSFAVFSFVPYFVHWNGQTWQEGTIPNPGMGGFRTVTALSATKVYAFGDEGGQRVIARWNGSAWSREAAPAAGTAGPLVDAAATGTGRIWAAGLRVESNGNVRTLAIGTANG